MKYLLPGLILLLSVTTVVAETKESGAACALDPGPEAAVRGYLTAMKDHHFEDAYKFVTATMTDGKSVAEWAGQQKKMFELGGVSIGQIDVRVAKRDMKDAANCAASATVPNVLHAGDVLNNQGSTEFETYKVLLQGKDWKIDSQETLFDEPRIREWFPKDKIPAPQETADHHYVVPET